MASAFIYSARARDGRAVRGTLVAESLVSAQAHLARRALCVTELLPASRPGLAALRSTFVGSGKKQARVAFFRVLAAMVSAGVPLRRAFDVGIERCEDEGFAEALRSLCADIEHGFSLSDAMSRRPREFSPTLCALVKAGETGGALDRVLERIALMLERERTTRKRIGAALAYPAVVATTACGLIVFLIVQTVPGFASMYDALRVPLPPSMRLLVEVGTTLRSPLSWLVLCAGCVGVAAVGAIAASSPRIREEIERVLLALPLFGPLQKKASVAAIARSLGMLMRGGVEVLSALAVVRDGLERRLFRRSMSDVRDALERGETLSHAMARSDLFDALVIHMVRAGEETGRLDDMLERLADYYDIDVETALAALTAIIEPLLMLVLGLAVGAIVASILLPLYSLIVSIR